MRAPDNPAKTAPPPAAPLAHRVIVPVYIPSLEGYYKDALDVLDLCLRSLHATSGSRVAITVISNGSTGAALEALEQYRQQGWIDQLIVNRQNRGKVDAALSVARGAFEELITISDGDVLFRSGWVEAMESLFQSFPECGLASPVPNPGSHCHWYHTSSTLIGAMSRGELQFASVVPKSDLDRFAHSIGRPDLYTPEARRAQLVVRRNGSIACVGCGHFVVTLRREVVQRLPAEPALVPIGGTSEELWIDAPPDRMGYWRLAPSQAFAYHIGNIPEPWMHEELRTLTGSGANGSGANGSDATLRVTLGRPRPSHLPRLIRSAVIRLARRSGFVSPANPWLRDQNFADVV